MLTTALNKSPKPPIIVDDILVNEFNLGSVPPELEILEIGDLAEDRFRGIFKMCYSGDAFLTLKTRVQVRLTFYSHHTYHHRASFPWYALLVRGICRSRRAICNPHTTLYHKANISTKGEPPEYLSLFQAFVCITSAPRSCVWLDDTTADYIIRNQTFGFHNPCVLATKRSHSCLPERPTRIPQSFVNIRLHTFREGLLTERD